jgi:hypothetical protein
MLTRKNISRAAALLALGLFIFTVGSCNLTGAATSDEDTGTLTLSIEMPLAMTIVPIIDMTPASYLVTGTGPNGKTFSLTTTKTSVSKSGLRSGVWTVSVSARNAAVAQIAQGSGNATVSGSQSVSLAVTVRPLPGNGSLSLTVTWNAAAIPAATLSGQLLPSSGSPVDLSFSMGSGTGTAAASIPAGYYTLTVQLLNGGVKLMGAVDVARIVQGQTTSGAYDFTQAVATGGTIVVGIVPVNALPLNVSLSGQLPTLALGASMTVTAGTAGYTGNVTYVWYLNGTSVATGSTANPSLTIGGNLAAGSYRLDVVAFSADGLRAGAATCAFTVQ